MPTTTKKRKSTSSISKDDQAAVKRPRQSISKSATPQRPVDDEERTELSAWLVKKNSQGSGIAFPIKHVTLQGKGKKGKALTLPANGYERTFELNDQPYGKAVFTIDNHAKWLRLIKFKKCTVGSESVSTGDCVIVDGNEPSTTPEELEDPSLRKWKAHVHEIRALSEEHVYVLVSWLYRPDGDLPTSGPDAAKSYHGRYELIPSNDLSIIDAMSIESKLSVKHLPSLGISINSEPTKSDSEPSSTTDADPQLYEGEYYWRQTYDVTASANHRLSSAGTMCACTQPQNPDRLVVQCPHCQAWMHDSCLERDAVQRSLESEEREKTPSSQLQTHPQLPVTPPADFVEEESESARQGQGTPEMVQKSIETVAEKGKKGKGKRKSEIAESVNVKISSAATGAAGSEPVADVLAELKIDEAAGRRVSVVLHDRRDSGAVHGEEKNREVPAKCLFCREIIDGAE